MANGWGWSVLILGLAGLTLGQNPEKRRTGNVCKIDMDCPDNAFCRLNSYCVCKEGFVYATINVTHKGCLMEATIGEDCVQDIQCQSTLGSHSECANEHICSCKPNAHLEVNRCYETAVVGERCLTDENCYLGDRSNPEHKAYCVRGYCSCELAHSPRDGGTRCVKDAGLGEVCEDQQQCAGAGLECHGECRCKEGWVGYNYTNTCLESVKALEEECEYDVQCWALGGLPEPGAALCLGGACNCSYNARRVRERCWLRRRPGEDCRRDEECVSEEDEPGYCLNGRCTCKTCTPSPSDFDGASTISQSPVIYLITVIISLAALIRH